MQLCSPRLRTAFRAPGWRIRLRAQSFDIREAYISFFVNFFTDSSLRGILFSVLFLLFHVLRSSWLHFDLFRDLYCGGGSDILEKSSLLELLNSNPKELCQGFY